MRSLPHDLRRTLAALAFTAAALAQAQAGESGTVSLQATVSGYVDIASGGPASLTGDSGGNITGNTNKGEVLSGVTIDFGDVSPVNTNPVVRAIVPLRLRSNIDYTLSVSTTGFANPDPLALQPQDVGFGIDQISRADSGVNLAGTDTPAPGVMGDPSALPDADPADPRHAYPTEMSLAHYVGGRAVLSGERIMRVVPASHAGGMTLETYFVIRPQFFTPGAFSTTVTFTLSTP